MLKRSTSIFRFLRLLLMDNLFLNLDTFYNDNFMFLKDLNPGKLFPKRGFGGTIVPSWTWQSPFYNILSQKYKNAMKPKKQT